MGHYSNHCQFFVLFPHNGGGALAEVASVRREGQCFSHVGSSMRQLLNGALLLCQKCGSFACPAKNLEEAVLIYLKILFLLGLGR